MSEEKHPVDRIAKGEGYVCDHCHTKILPGEMYYHFHRRTGWYEAHSNLTLCNNRREGGKS